MAMKNIIFITIIMIVFASCNTQEEVQPFNDFAGNYKCSKFSFESYYIPAIDSTTYWYDTAEVVITINHCTDPDSIIITLEGGGKVDVVLTADSTFSDFDPHDINIGTMSTSGSFFGNDSIHMKRSYWSDEQYYHRYLYRGKKMQQ
jgi:hypothetical protein